MQLRGRGKGDPWVEAARQVLANGGIRDSLFRHYKSLVDLATNYNTMERSGSWRKDQGYIGAEVRSTSLTVMLTSHFEQSLRLAMCT